MLGRFGKKGVYSMRPGVSMVLGAGAVLAALCGGPSRAEDEPALDPAKLRAAIERVEKAPAAERRRTVFDLIAFGPGALGEVRRARDAADDPQAKEALGRAARWILAGKLKPVLIERYDTGLTFDGQYSDLRAEGPEAAESLLALLDDEESPGRVRIAAARALADTADESILPRLRRMDSDPLLPELLQEETGVLMAIFGDTRRHEKKIQELSAKVERRTGNALQRFQDNIDLANLYYRIRRYKSAIECFDRAIEILEALRPRLSGDPDTARGIAVELAQTYYNAACSLSLQKEIERARAMIKKAVALDLNTLKNLEKDGDLKNLRESPGYAEFKKELEKPLEKKSI